MLKRRFAYGTIVILMVALLYLLPTNILNGKAFSQVYDDGVQNPVPTSSSILEPALVWLRLDIPILPPPRNGFSMTYNPTNQIALVFGGFASSFPGDLNDLWLTNGRQWMEFQTPHTPEGRVGAGMAYDEARQAAVLFGGFDNWNLTYFDDTWIFNGIDWVEQHPQNAPSPRSNAKMVYDPIRNITYLFGGLFSIDKWDEIFGDMWAWDGVDWQQLFPSTLPPVRLDAQMVFDPVHQNILLFGGGSYAAPLNDTWIWDSGTWTELHPAHHPSYFFYVSGMTYDEGRQQVVLFGSDFSDNAEHRQTWVWDGQDWEELQTNVVLANEMPYSGELVYLPNLQTIMYFGEYFEKNIDPDNSIERSEAWALTSRYLLYFPEISR
jgi:hypothetical protein